MVERFIKDPEFGVPVLGAKPDEVLDVVEVTLNGKSMDKNYLTSKIVYRDDYSLDVADTEGTFLEYKALALKAYNSLRCRNFGRVDI